MGIRTIFKRAVTCLGALLVSPFALIARLEQLLGTGELFFQAFAELLSLVPSLLGSYLRQGYYLLTLERCGWDVAFCFGATVNHRTCRIGNHITIGGHASLGTVTVKDHVLISPRVSILSGGRQHETGGDVDDITHARPIFERVEIGSHSWIGEGAIVLADIGERCVVAAGAVVTRPVPDQKLVAGNPARAMAREWNSA